MLSSLRRWRHKRFLESARLPDHEWRAARERLPLLAGLTAGEEARLGALALLFLREKSLENAGGHRLTPQMALDIALQACLPVMNLGFEWLEGWVSVVVYPDNFLVHHDEMDEAGVVHHIHEARSGEAWELGPVVLSWQDVEDGAQLDGYNVVIHEVAHKLDGRDGAVNGMPPLHGDMDLRRWSEVFGRAYRALEEAERRGDELALDPYALESPAEFFAVASEEFFERPGEMRELLPELYEQLAAFYRQDPAQRLAWPELKA